MNKEDRIYIAGHRGMVGSALVRSLKSHGYANLITRTHAELDLANQSAVNDFFANEPIDVVFLAAAKVGGIQANNIYRADFIYQNLMIQANVIHAAYKAGIQRLLFLGSSCIYPKQCPQPMKEEHLLSGYLEPTNEPYAIAKIAGINQCQSYNRQYGTKYRVVMPTNLYGPNDNFDLENSHVLPAMIRKFHLSRLALEKDFDAIHKDEVLFGQIPGDIWQALKDKPPAVTLWGSGIAKRQFLHVDDMADACLHVMTLSDRQYQDTCRAAPEFRDHGINAVSHINVGYDQEVSIGQLSEIIKEVVGYKGDVIWDASIPDGMLRKLMDTRRLKDTGWHHRIDLIEGIRDTYQWYLSKVFCH
ncbi:MAG: GDP-L-fucose synthase [Desulfobacteraceae bacterium]|jgi:GDP-L-fucose synthase